MNGISRKVVLILLVEDEFLIMASDQDALEQGGYTVETAENGHAALALMAERAAELASLITDIRLGAGPNGWEIAHRARELNREIAVVYTTGDSVHDWHSKGVPDSVVLQRPYAAA